MGSVQEHLYAIERELAAAGGDAYRRHLREDAEVVVPPGERLDKEAASAAVDASGGWEEFSIEEESMLLLGPDTALLTYRFAGRRGDFEYAALLTSAYARLVGDGEWKLVFHQQTPIG